MPKFGLIYDFRNPPQWRKPWAEFYDELLDEVQLAEALGYDHVWVTEHHFIDDGYTPSVLPIAAAIARLTSRVRIGTWVLLLPLHNAIRVAEDAATVDLLSNGRFDLGVGLGYRIEEFEGFGVDRRHRASLMEESLEIITRTLNGETVSLDGRHYQVKNVTVTPQPIQKPFPLWVGARSIPAARARRPLPRQPDDRRRPPRLRGLGGAADRPGRRPPPISRSCSPAAASSPTTPRRSGSSSPRTSAICATPTASGTPRPPTSAPRTRSAACSTRPTKTCASASSPARPTRSPSPSSRRSTGSPPTT